jgi:holliday junction DNA helicase RuvB
MTEPIFDIAAGSPPTLDHVIGNKRVVRQIRTALDAYFNDRATVSVHSEPPALAHILLVGPAGLGKSMLSGIIARELGTQLHEELGQNLSTPGHLHGLLMLAESGDCIFVDEVHELHPLVQTALYRAVEEGKLFIPTRGGERQNISLPPLTLISATTDEWALSKPLRDRFKIILRLEHYSETELENLLQQRVHRLGWSVSDDALKGIAARGRGTPRLAMRLLESARRMTRALDETEITVANLTLTCNIEEIDTIGLDSLEQQYLTMLKEESPLRLNILATRLGLPTRTIEKIVESDLIRLGLVSKDDSGRILTAAGREHLKKTEKVKK